MRLGIMQPYFFPYLGYLDLINYSDKWIIFDSVQYIRKGWMNRNRILHPTTSWQYIGMPIKKSRRSTLIKDIEINDTTDWRGRILGQLQHYKKKAPYFPETFGLVEKCLKDKEIRLSRLNGAILEKVCNYLEIQFDYEYFSEMNLPLTEIASPGDWALYISESLNADEYVNPSGGTELFSAKRFDDVGIQLTIRDIPPIKYNPIGYDFIAKLSIIDILMWNSPEQVLAYLNRQ